MFVAEKMCEDIDVCHKFMKEVAPYVGKFSKRGFLTVFVRRSDCLLRNKIVSLSEMYPVGFRDRIFILKRGHVLIFT